MMDETLDLYEDKSPRIYGHRPAPFFICVIQLEKHGSKKNRKTIARNRKTGKMFIRSDDAEALISQSMTKRFFYEAQAQGIMKPYTGPVWMQATFVFKREDFFCKAKGKGGPAGRRNSKIPDLSNLYQLPEDCLQSAKVIENDSQIDSHDGSRRIPGDSTRLELRLYPMPS